MTASSSDHRAPRDAGLGRNDDAAANLYVVRDLHEVVDLAPRTDLCRSQRSPVDGRIGPDLDVGLDAHVPHLRELQLSRVVANVAEPVVAHDHPGVQLDPVAQLGSRIQDDARMQDALLAEHAAFVDDDARLEDRSPSDPRSRPDAGVRPDIHVRIDRGLGGDGGGWVMRAAAVARGWRSFAARAKSSFGVSETIAFQPEGMQDSGAMTHAAATSGSGRSSVGAR